LKITFLCFDLSDNSLGRAALLASGLARHHEVELVGPMKGKALWFPLKDLDLAVRTFPWRRLPRFACTVREMVHSIQGDLLFACKLRPTSFGVGVLKKRESGVPLLVDIDDWEVGFYYHSGFWGKVGRFLNLSNPNGLPYTWLMERLVSRADGITVSNRFLQDRFSGTLIPHCRDTRLLDPARHDGKEIRKRLGVEDKKVVMFLGTPRGHKGVGDLLAAVLKVQDPGVHLVVVGLDDPGQFMAGSPKALTGRLTALSKVPFHELPQYLAAADVMAIPQQRTSDTIGQMPAKIFDAMAMAKPIISTRVSDIPEVLGDGGYLVEPGNVDELARAIDHVLHHPEEARQKGQRARERCVEFYDTRVMEARLLELVKPFA
jgi:glycosyltransferase involved in cell wall biosynthesis